MFHIIMTAVAGWVSILTQAARVINVYFYDRFIGQGSSPIKKETWANHQSFWWYLITKRLDSTLPPELKEILPLRQQRKLDGDNTRI